MSPPAADVLAAVSSFDFPWGRSQPLGHDYLANPGSSVFRIELQTETGNRTVYVKYSTSAEGSPARADSRLAEELGHLRRLAPEFAGRDRLHVIQGLGLTPDGAGLITEGVSGVSLQSLLGRSWRVLARSGHEPVLRYCEDAGRFLRQLHDEAAGIIDGTVSEEIYRYCDARLSTLTRLARSKLTPRDASAVRGALAARLSSALSDREALVFSHMDYAPHNILLSAGEVWILDFYWSGPAPRAFDVACFVEKVRDLSYEPHYSGRFLRQAEARFMTGYGVAVDEGSVSYDVARLRLVLSKLVTMARSAPRRPDRWLSDRRRSVAYLRWLRDAFA